MTKTAAVLALTNALLAVLLAFGVHLSTDQRVAITGAVNAVLVAAAAFWDPHFQGFGRTADENGNGNGGGSE